MKFVFLSWVICIQFNSLFSQQNYFFCNKEFNSFFTDINNDIWIASAGHGWNQYRGIDTKHFLNSDSILGLKGSFIQSKLFRDKRWQYWSSTYEYLVKYDPILIKFYSTKLFDNNGKELINGYHVLDYSDADDLLIIRANNALYTYEPDKAKIKNHLGHTLGNFFTTWQDTIAAAPWINGEGFELWNRNKQTWSKSYITASTCSLLKGRKVTKILHFEQNIWLITDDGLILYNLQAPNKSIVYKYILGERNSLIDADILDHKIIMGSDDHGLVIFDTRKRNFLPNFTKFSKRVNYVFVDKHNRLWLSNATSGVSTFYPYEVMHQTLNLNRKTTWKCIKESTNYQVLLDEENGFIITKEGKKRKFNIPNPKLPVTIIKGIEILDDDRLLICGLFDNYIYSWNNNSLKKIKLEGAYQVQDVAITKNKVTLIADNKIWKYDIQRLRLENISKYTKYQGAFQFVCFQSDSLNTYSHSSTHLLISSKKTDTLVDVKSFVNNATFVPLTKEHFVSTNNGLVKIDKYLKVIHLTKNHEILNGFATFDIFYQDSWIYANTSNHIFRIHDTTNEIQILDVFEFKNVPRFYLDNQNIVLALDTVVSLKIASAFEPNHKYQMQLDYIKVNEILFNQKTDKFDFTQSSFEWKYYIGNTHLPNQCKIKYRLLPIDTTWHLKMNGEPFKYNQLQPNKYILQVKGMNSDGRWVNQIQFPFTISPPWYQTIWFTMLFTFCVGSLIILLYKWRIRQIKHKYTIQTEISNLQRSALQAQMNPHFIFNCLNSIQNFIMQNEKLEAMDYLNRFANLIRQNLDASTSSTILLSDELDMLKNYIELEQMRFNHAFDYAIHIGDKLDIGSTYIPPLLIQPFVENAILHGVAGIEERGKIQIDISKVHQYLYIHIIDNGRGITDHQKDKMHKSHAMKITSQRLDYINSAKDKLYNINTTSSEKGTHITISVYLPDVVKS
ncbi:MAG TPA: histidine kinase [Saprospiraceae bacterium]|nr:histidine kinase [Saprospiraceae bacterium]